MKYLGPPQSGSQAGTTASHNRAGQYLRNRRTPTSPTRTPKQQVARQRFGTASALWQSLTGTLQAAWTSFAANYPVKDSLGQSIVLTGQQFFVGIQSTLLSIAQPTNASVPSNTTLNPVDTPAMYIDDSGNFVVSVASVSAGDVVRFGASKILSNGKNFNKTFSAFGLLNNGALVVDISAAFEAQYGLGLAGRKVFGSFLYVNSSGMSGNQAILQTPVVTSPVTVTPTVVNTTPGTVVSTATGTGTEVQELWQDQVGLGFYTMQASQAGVAGVATFTVVTAGFPSFTRLHVGPNYGPRSNVFTSV